MMLIDEKGSFVA